LASQSRRLPGINQRGILRDEHAGCLDEGSSYAVIIYANEQKVENDERRTSSDDVNASNGFFVYEYAVAGAKNGRQDGITDVLDVH